MEVNQCIVMVFHHGRKLQAFQFFGIIIFFVLLNSAGRKKGDAGEEMAVTINCNISAVRY